MIFLLLLAASFGFAETSPTNWSGNYPPCNHHPDLLNRNHVVLGVRISTSNKTLARQFAKALDFWSRILDLEWHEVDSQDCSIQLVDGTPDLFDPSAIAARSQYPDRPAFQGWIAFNPNSKLTERDMFHVSIHEIGHLLGLPHNPSGSSVMFFLNLDEPLSLDTTDLVTLSRQHTLRAGIFSNTGTAAAQVRVP